MSPGKRAIGARLREEREAPPYWSRPDLARLMRDAADPRDRPGLPHVKPLAEMIKHWEVGKATPSPRYRALYCRVTGKTEAELFGDQPPAQAARPTTGGRLASVDGERLAYAVRHPVRVDMTVVESLATILAAQRSTEDVVGSAPLLAPVRAHLTMLENLVTEARGPIRPHLVSVAAQWAQFNGWLTSNCGDLAAGKGWLDRALEWAVEADERNLVSEVLSFKGHVAWRAGQPGPVIGLSEAAMRPAGLYPGQYAMSSAQQARGYAMVGDAEQAERLLDRAVAEAAAARERQDEAPPWLYYHSPGYFELQRGLIYRCLGAHRKAYNRRAVDALHSGLNTLPDGMQASEWAGEFIYHLGRAHAQSGDLDQAQAHAEELVGIAGRIGSDRLARQAAELL